MKERIAPLVCNAKNLDEVKVVIVKLLGEIKRENGTTQIGYVAGIISSDGPEYIQRNLQILAYYTGEIRALCHFPIFSSTDIFTKEIFGNLPEMRLPHNEREKEFKNFWRGILESGYVTDIFMTPSWKTSIGAQDEHVTSITYRIAPHYVYKKDTDLIVPAQSIIGPDFYITDELQ